MGTTNEPIPTPEISPVRLHVTGRNGGDRYTDFTTALTEFQGDKQRFIDALSNGNGVRCQSGAVYRLITFEDIERIKSMKPMYVKRYDVRQTVNGVASIVLVNGDWMTCIRYLTDLGLEVSQHTVHTLYNGALVEFPQGTFEFIEHKPRPIIKVDTDTPLSLKGIDGKDAPAYRFDDGTQRPEPIKNVYFMLDDLIRHAKLCNAGPLMIFIDKYKTRIDELTNDLCHKCAAEGHNWDNVDGMTTEPQVHNSERPVALRNDKGFKHDFPTLRDACQYLKDQCNAAGSVGYLIEQLQNGTDYGPFLKGERYWITYTDKPSDPVYVRTCQRCGANQKKSIEVKTIRNEVWNDQ